MTEKKPGTQIGQILKLKDLKCVVYTSFYFESRYFLFLCDLFFVTTFRITLGTN
jgi:hypothetical protein